MLMSQTKKWLTDITEFAIHAGKVYLSPIIDCFDGMVVSWNISTTRIKQSLGYMSPKEYRHSLGSTT